MTNIARKNLAGVSKVQKGKNRFKHGGGSDDEETNREEWNPSMYMIVPLLIVVDE